MVQNMCRGKVNMSIHTSVHALKDLMQKWYGDYHRKILHVLLCQNRASTSNSWSHLIIFLVNDMYMLLSDVIVFYICKARATIPFLWDIAWIIMGKANTPFIITLTTIRLVLLIINNNNLLFIDLKIFYLIINSIGCCKLTFLHF